MASCIADTPDAELITEVRRIMDTGFSYQPYTLARHSGPANNKWLLTATGIGSVIITLPFLNDVKYAAIKVRDTLEILSTFKPTEN